MPLSSYSTSLLRFKGAAENSRFDLNRNLMAAAERMKMLSGNGPPQVVSSLRSEQRAVTADFQDYLLDIATCPETAETSAFARIVLPPRTGKTVIAAHLIGITGLQTTFIVPTRNLIHQVADELRSHLPGVPIGLYYGEVKETVTNGINVATYNILQSHYKKQQIPKEIRKSVLVFVDEAHHAMTENRMEILKTGFESRAIRIALTATPDYSAERRLKHHFPKLISEISLYDALDSNLLAPLRMWVAEVDADASKVRIIAGDYDGETLGRLMSSAPFFRAAEIFRYQTDNRSIPALISCASRRQAYDLKAYLDRHRPKSRPAPAIILGETPDKARIDILERFENGVIDTLIQVGVLIEGWNSPSCKLLIDLAPSRSRVRATQKFFRVMTKNSDSEARIYVIIPSVLNALPLLPTDLFGNPFEEYECGTLINKGVNDASKRETINTARTPIDGVKLRKRILCAQTLTKLTLDRKNLVHIRRILQSSRAFNAEMPCGFMAFQKIHFSHPLFVGSGGLLLDHCRIRDRFSYHNWMIQLYPESIANSYLPSGERKNEAYSNEADLTRLFEEGDAPPHIRRQGWFALGGRLEQPWRNPEDLALRCEDYAKLWRLIDKLKPRERSILIMRFGLDGSQEKTLSEIGRVYQLCGTRIMRIIAKAMLKIRKWWPWND